MKQTYRQYGFTVVEILIVIIVIGILAAVTIVSYNDAVEKAKIGQANAELSELAGIIRTAVARKGVPLASITGNEWTMSYCVQYSASPNVKMSTLAKTNRCWTDYIAAVNAISTAAGVSAPQKLLDGDPWGGPYLLDENENEETCDSSDSLQSAGKENIPWRPSSITIDISYNFSQPC